MHTKPEQNLIVLDLLWSNADAAIMQSTDLNNQKGDPPIPTGEISDEFTKLVAITNA